MPTTESLSLRVNGIEVKRVGLQFGLKDGYPSGPEEVVIKDYPTVPFTPFTLTDDFIIELQDEGRGWKRVSLRYLITILQAYRED